MTTCRILRLALFILLMFLATFPASAQQTKDQKKAEAQLRTVHGPVSYTHLDVYKRQGEDLGMEEDSLNRTFLGPKRGIRLNEKDSCNEKKSRIITRKVSHPITLSKVSIAQNSNRQATTIHKSFRL